MTVQELAKEALRYFIRKRREDGSEYVAVTKDRPEWVHQMVYAAHNDGEILPDDWRYEFVLESLYAIEDSDPDELDELELEADASNSALLEWLNSSMRRVSYVDEAIEELGWTGHVMDAIEHGQYIEKNEVLRIVLEFLREIAD